jgi:pimeloyl-ACP methyl ester carboxylesterase
MLTPNVERWRAAGGFEEIAGRRLYVQRRAGEGPLLLLLHGFPSSSYDWRELLALRAGRAALAFDFLGFGLSDKPADHVYTLAWQADAAEQLVRLAGSPARRRCSSSRTTWARRSRPSCSHASCAARRRSRSPGRCCSTARSCSTARARRPGQKLLRSRLGPLFARLTNERSFRLQFGRIFSPAHPLTRAQAEDQWALLADRGGQRIGHLLVSYMAERERYVERWHGAFRDWPGRLSLAWGLEDPVATTAVLDGLRELRPGVPVSELPGVGHYPQLERPELIAAALDAALAEV